MFMCVDAVVAAANSGASGQGYVSPLRFRVQASRPRVRGERGSYIGVSLAQHRFASKEIPLVNRHGKAKASRNMGRGGK